MRSTRIGLFFVLCAALLVVPFPGLASAEVSPTELGDGIPIAAAANAAGDQAILFRDNEGPWIRVRQAGGAWSSPQPVPHGGGGLLDLDIDGAGTATVAWVNGDEAASATWTISGWSEVVKIEAPGPSGWSVYGVQPGAGGGLDVLDVNESGAAVFTYLAGEVKAAYRTAEGTWGPAQSVGSGSDQWGMATIDDAGVATVLWKQRNVPSAGAWLMASTSSGRIFSAAEVLAHEPGAMGSAALAGNSAGVVAVGWAAASEDGSAVTVRTRHPDESWGPATTVVSGSGLGPVTLSVSESGDVAAAWSETSESAVRVRASASRGGGTWVEPRTVGRVSRESTADLLGDLRLTPVPDNRWLVVYSAYASHAGRIWMSSWAPEDQVVPAPTLFRESETTLGDPYGPVDFVLAHDPGSPAALVAWTELRIFPYSQVLRTAQIDVTRDLPTAELVEPATRFAPNQSITVSWTGTPGATFTVLRRSATPEGRWTAYDAWTTTTQHQAVFRGRPGSTYCFMVSATTPAGTESTPSAERCVAVPIDDRALAASGQWTRTGLESAYDGTISTSFARGSELRFRLRAKDAAVVARTCSRCGNIAIHVDGTRARTISLAGAAGARTIPLGRSVRHRVRLVVLSSGKPVHIDAVRASRI